MIYEQFDKAFKHTAAGVILKNGAFYGRYAIKYPNDGAGRLTMFLHIFGQPMVKGTASGYGYDKASAAFQACAKSNPVYFEALEPAYRDAESRGFREALTKAGFTVLDAI